MKQCFRTVKKRVIQGRQRKARIFAKFKEIKQRTAERMKTIDHQKAEIEKKKLQKLEIDLNEVITPCGAFLHTISGLTIGAFSAMIISKGHEIAGLFMFGLYLGITALGKAYQIIKRPNFEKRLDFILNSLKKDL